MPEKPEYEIMMSKEAVIEMLKKNEMGHDYIKSLDTVGIITEGQMKGRILFRGEQYPIIDGKVIKD